MAAQQNQWPLALTVRCTLNLLAAVLLVGHAQAAAAATSGLDGFLIGGSAFFISDQSEQGSSKLPGGTTLLSQVSLQYNSAAHYCGVGVVYEYDKMGQSQTNTSADLKLEATFHSFYADLTYGQMHQAFAGRAIQSRQGTHVGLSLGARFLLGKTFYLEGGVRQSKAMLTKQDGAAMAQGMTETTTMPYIGVGVNL